MRLNPKIVSLDPLQAAAAGLLVPNAPPMLELMDATADTPGLLRRLGYRHPYDLEEEVLGAGTYARAFATPSGEVLKLTTDPADAAVSQLVARDGPLPGLIRVKAVYRMPAKVRLNRSDAEPTADLYAVISERVTPLADMDRDSHEAGQLNAARVGLAVAQSSQDLRDLGPLRDLLADAMSEAEYSDIDEQGTLYLYDLVQGWYWMAQRGFHMKDLHEGNVALTEDGRAVLLDLGLSMRGVQPELQLAVNPSTNVDAVFDETFDRIEELFPDFGTVEFYEDEKAGADNGAGSERQFAYCQDGNPIAIAFAPKAAKLGRPQLLGLMRHEFGHALEYRYGVKELEKRLGKKLPPQVERRADVIAELVWGEPIVYDEHLVQCVNVNGVRPRPARLPDERAQLKANPGDEWREESLAIALRTSAAPADPRDYPDAFRFAEDFREVRNPEAWDWCLVRSVPVSLFGPASEEDYLFEAEAAGDEDEAEDAEESLDKFYRAVELVESGEDIQPILVDSNGMVLDGYHRIAALFHVTGEAATVDVLWARKPKVVLERNGRWPHGRTDEEQVRYLFDRMRAEEEDGGWGQEEEILAEARRMVYGDEE